MPDPTTGSDALFFLAIGLTFCAIGIAGVVAGWK